MLPLRWLPRDVRGYGQRNRDRHYDLARQYGSQFHRASDTRLPMHAPEASPVPNANTPKVVSLLYLIIQAQPMNKTCIGMRSDKRVAVRPRSSTPLLVALILAGS